MRRLRFIWVLTAALVAFVALGVGSATGVEPPALQHGIGVTKGCTSPTNVGDPYSCAYTIRNVLDEAEDTVTINGLRDVVHAAGGDVDSGNILGSVQVTTTTTATGTTPSGASCSAGAGTGVFPTPYTGVTSCTLPFGSRVNVLAYTHYNVQPADFGLTDHKLHDDAYVTWHDKCDGDTTSNCDEDPVDASAASLTVVEKLSSSTATEIHNDGVHAAVTTVAAGSTVHDKVTVSGPAGKPTPTGKVNVDWFTNGTCKTPATSNSGSVGPLVGGAFDATAFTQTPLAAGKYSFKGHYEGDGTYTGSDGDCEPLTVVDANIAITPQTATNPTRTNHTFTVTVKKDIGDGAGLVAANGEHVTASIVNSGGATATIDTALSTCDDAGANTNSSGECTLVITSPTAGQTKAFAAVTLTVGGVSLTRDADSTTAGVGHGPNGTDEATKTWEEQGGQITDTSVSCYDVLSGDAAQSVIEGINYPSSKGKIGQGINPGKFFFWTRITTTIPNQVVTVSQDNDSTNNAALFEIHQGWDRIYKGDCSKWTAGEQNAGQTGASFTVPTPGNYVIGIKYDPKSIVGAPVPVPATITYDFTTSLGGATGASVDLRPK